MKRKSSWSGGWSGGGSGEEAEDSNFSFSSSQTAPAVGFGALTRPTILSKEAYIWSEEDTGVEGWRLSQYGFKLQETEAAENAIEWRTNNTLRVSMREGYADQVTQFWFETIGRAQTDDYTVAEFAVKNSDVINSAYSRVTWSGTAVHDSAPYFYVQFRRGTASAANAWYAMHDGVVKQGWFGATPVAKAGATSDIKDALVNYGLLTDGGATPLNLDGGALTAASYTATTAFIGPIWRPASDSTTALRMQNAAGTSTVVTIDTTNKRVGIGGTPGGALAVYGIEDVVQGLLRGHSTQYNPILAIRTSANANIFVVGASGNGAQLYLGNFVIGSTGSGSSQQLQIYGTTNSNIWLWANNGVARFDLYSATAGVQQNLFTFQTNAFGTYLDSTLPYNLRSDAYVSYNDLSSGGAVALFDMANLNVTIGGSYTVTAAKFYVVDDSASKVAQRIDLASSATANAFEVRNSSSSILFQIDKAGAFIANEGGADADCRIEGDTDANLFFSDASTDRIGVGTATPSYKLHIAGDLNLSSTYVYRINGTQILAAQGAAVADAAGGATIDAEARTALNAVLARLRAHGIIAT